MGGSAALVGVVLLGGLLSFVFYPLSTSFNVTAHTERLLFRTGPASDAVFDLSDVSVFDGSTDERQSFDGQFRVATGVEVRVERIALGPLRIALESTDGKAAGTYLRNDEPVGQAGPYVEFSVADPPGRAREGRTVLVPVTGVVEPGRNVGGGGGGTTSILRSGKVAMLGRSIFSQWFAPNGQVFNAGSISLDAGDQFRVVGAETPAYGFVVVDERPGMIAAYRVQGRQGVVSRPGPTVSGYSVSVSFLERILNDRLFRALSLLITGIVIVVTVLGFVIRWIQFRETPRRREVPDYSDVPDDAKSTGPGTNSESSSAPVLRLPPSPTCSSSVTVRFLALGMGLLFLAGGLLPVESRAQEAVYVEAEQEGQGVLRARGADCIVITPAHVYGENARGAYVTDSRGVRVSARSTKTYESADLALLRIEESGSVACEQWLPIDNLGSILENAQNGHLKVRGPGGTTRFIPVQLGQRDRVYITVRPIDSGNPAHELKQTMSGSPLIVNNMTVGLLMRLDEEDSDEGIVYQLDDIMRITAPNFPDAVRRPATPDINVDAAQAILDRALENQDGSSQGQVAALEVLLTQGHTFSSANFSGVALPNAQLGNATFEGAQFQAAHLQNVQASKANFGKADFRFARLTDGVFRSADLHRSYAPFVEGQGTTFDGADLSKASFFGANLRNVRCRDATLRGTALVFADLRGADFDGADLTGAYLAGSVFDESTSFQSATFKDTEVTGAALSDVSLTDAQKQGLCRRVVRGSSGLLLWNVTLMERWASNRYSTGYQYEKLPRSQEALEGFDDESLPLCSTPPDASRGHHATYLGEKTILLERTLISKAGRRVEFLKRVSDHAAFLSEFLSVEHTVKGDGSQRAQWGKDMKKAASTAGSVSKPYFTTDLLIAVLLSEGLLSEERMNWTALARNRHRFESAVREERNGDFSGYSMWGPFYPSDVPWEALPEETVELYRSWILKRAGTSPRRMIVRSKAYPPRGSGTTLTIPIRINNPLDGRSGANSWPDGLHHTLKREGIDLSRTRFVPVYTHTAGIQRVLFVFPGPMKRYHVKVPSRSVQGISRRNIEMSLSLEVEKIEPVLKNDHVLAALIFVTPVEAELIGDGKVLWTGRVTTQVPTE